MNPLWIPLLALIIPIVAILGGVFVRPWMKLQERKLELNAQMTAEKAAQYAAHTERLEQRMRVLERIVTDKGLDIADEIERLRDTPVIYAKD
jgi:ABC-type phosphate transport system auxiliary subunit